MSLTVGQWLVLGYFLVIHVTYIGLNVLACFSITRSHLRRFGASPPVDPVLMPPVTVVIPAYDEEATIVGSVQSVLQLTYPTFEVVVVNDGSNDRTLEALREAFDLRAYGEAYRDRIATVPVRAFYLSGRYRNLRVIDKENGGKADAVNVAINAARYQLFCTIDSDSILQRDSLQRVARPFLDDARVVASGGTIRIANGCKVREGFLEEMGLPDKRLVLFQVMEYLRAFLFGRMGWARFNGLLVLSGAFAMFRKEVVIGAGGFRTDTLGEDMELVTRLHRVMRQQKRPYRIAYVPDPICFTEAPETVRGLATQRIRWQRGLAETLQMNRGLAFRGSVGWVSYPFHLLFELFGSFVENFGYRQLNAWWRLVGLVRHLRGTAASWGELERSASWQSATSTANDTAGSGRRAPR